MCSRFPPCISGMFASYTYMGWLRLVGSLNSFVSFSEYSLFYRSLLQKRPMLGSLLMYQWHVRIICIYICTYHIHICICIMATHTYIYTYVYTYNGDTHIHIYICVYVYIYHIHICRYIMATHTYIYTYMYKARLYHPVLQGGEDS